MRSGSQGLLLRIAQVRHYALSLPEVTEEPHHHFSSFRVRGKIFVTVPPDEEHIHVFIDEEAREMALALHPAFLEELTWGRKIVGVRVSLASAEASIVETLIDEAWTRRAPKGLSRQSSVSKKHGKS